MKKANLAAFHEWTFIQTTKQKLNPCVKKMEKKIEPLQWYLQINKEHFIYISKKKNRRSSICSDIELRQGLMRW